MELIVEGKQVPLTSAVVVDSLSQLYTVIEIYVPNYISEQYVTLRNKKDIKCRVLRMRYANNTYNYTLVSEKSWQLLNTNCEAFHGNADVKTLLSSVGVNQKIDVATDKVDWTIPRIKFKVLLEYLNKYASIQSGGAPRFYVDIDGELSCVDLKVAYNSTKAEELKCTIDEDFASMDWSVVYPGTVDIICYTKDGIKVESVKEGPGIGIVRINDTTGTALSQIRQRIKNEFNINYYTSRQLKAVNVQSTSYELGALVQIHDVEQKFIIYGRSFNIPLHGEAPIVTLNLCAPWQKL